MESTYPTCWKTIGITGDNSCPTLKQVTHCRNCSVYVSAGRALLHREIPQGYQEEWTRLLGQDCASYPYKTHYFDPSGQKNTPTFKSLMIFRIAHEWLALPVKAIKEVTQPRSIHTVPHRSNYVFLGVVNIRGEILMCVSLGSLLGLSEETGHFSSSSVPLKTNPVVYPRMTVMQIQENRWVFPVDEIAGVHKIAEEKFKDVPVVVAKTPDTYTKKIFDWESRKVSCLDDELLFYELLFYTLNRT